MRLGIRHLCLLILLVPFCNGCTFLKLKYERVVYENGKEEINKESTIESLIPNGKEMSILPEKWMDYKANAKAIVDIDAYTVYGEEISKPEPVTIRWTNKNETSKYTFILSSDKSMADSRSFETDQTYIDVKDLYANTMYYYQIKAQYDGYYVISKRFDFKTIDYFRTIQIDGVLNCRDLGNKKTVDGKKRVKQGLVYRTANFDSVKPQGKIDAIEKYGIKTDLDLREQGPTESPLGASVKYVNNGVGTEGSPHYVSLSYGVNVAYYQTAMRDNLKVFSDKNNLPLAFHCAVGRDRTGTLAITLLLILGVDLYQIREDYAVSFFSKACNSYEYSDYENSLNNLFKYYENYKGEDGKDKGNIFERVEKYCYHIGLSKNDISAIRSNLLEKI